MPRRPTDIISTKVRRKPRVISRVENALELLVAGRLSAPYHAPYRVVRQQRNYAVRHYGEDGVFEPGARPPTLLVPPLMVASEVFDLDPEISGVQALMDAGLDVWLTDFGAPELQEGGMQRTLRDHVLAVSETVDEIVAQTGRPVHLVGYSQGGMFVYQAAAYRRSEGVASCVTFGSPVDFLGKFEGVREETAAALLRGMVATFRAGIGTAEGFSARLTGGGFRAIGAHKQPGQIASFFKQLHNRRALEQQERRRRFLHGEGFVGFPGPALDDLVDLMLDNRLAKGGLVIEGKTVSLVDVTCPILYFIATNDALAPRPVVTAVAQAAPHAPCYEAQVSAGHFGMIVGSKAVEETWPTVADWIRATERRRRHAGASDQRPRRLGRLAIRGGLGTATQGAPLVFGREGSGISRGVLASRCRSSRGRRQMDGTACGADARLARKRPRQYGPPPRRAGDRHVRGDLLPMGGPRVFVLRSQPPGRCRSARAAAQRRTTQVSASGS